MASMTPEEIQALAEPVEQMYSNIVDELLINIGKHLRSNSTTWTAYWEVEKLAEMGQLTEENIAIINKYVAEMPEILKESLNDSRKLALANIESQLATAAKDGFVTPPITDSTVAVYRNLLNQAAERLNLTNTVMLESTADAYQNAVHMTAERAEAIRREGEFIEGQNAAAVASGVVARQTALKETIQKLSDAGLTGFYDHAGRGWSPEAYVNMVMRTTVHNTAIESTRARMEDYGTSVIQISSHGGARPLCYPYQGKFYSWDGSSGEIELGDGRTVHYEALSSTSYGQPAGIFGINCGHYPIPIIPGVTIPHGADNIEPEEENNKNYQESQQQRALERKVREAKRVVEMAGDLATDKQKQAVKDAQAAVRNFTNETGRARRYDREQIYPAKSPKKGAQVQTTGPSTVTGASGNAQVKAVKPGTGSITSLTAELNELNARMEKSTDLGEMAKIQQRQDEINTEISSLRKAETEKTRASQLETISSNISSLGLFKKIENIEDADVNSANAILGVAGKIKADFPETILNKVKITSESMKGSTHVNADSLGKTTGTSIVFSKKYFGDYDMTAGILSEEYKSGHSAFATTEGAVAHEMGHALANAFKVGGKDVVQQIMIDNGIDPKQGMSKEAYTTMFHISDYGEESSDEWLSECFADYYTNNEPQDISVTAIETFKRIVFT